MKVLKFDSPIPLFSEMATELVRIGRAAVADRGIFQLVLNGGGTPAGLFRMLAGELHRSSDIWRATKFWWGDERAVRPDAEGSNYRMAKELLLDPLGIEESQIRRMKGELDPVEAAVHYTELLRRAAGPGRGWPQFDLVLLGLGKDGHTASLFPGYTAPEGAAVVATVADYEGRPADRISLTPAAINSARNVWFMVVGEEKAGIVGQVLHGPRDPLHLPAQRVDPEDGEVAWWLAI